MVHDIAHFKMHLEQLIFFTLNLFIQFVTYHFYYKNSKFASKALMCSRLIKQKCIKKKKNENLYDSL